MAGREGFTDWLPGRRAVVFGLARSGQAAAELLRSHGAHLTGVDETRSRVESEWSRDHLDTASAAANPDLLLGADLFVLSPGIPLGHPFVQAALAAGLPVRSEIEIGYLCCPAHVVAVTGSKGKSTTTALAGALLAAQGKRCLVAGNIGRPYCEVAPQLGPEDWVVLEVSSFQLETVDQFHARVAVLLGVSPDHLDRYPSFEAYAAAKMRIARHQGREDVLVVDPGDRWGAALARQSEGRTLGFGTTWEGRGVVRRGPDIVWLEPESSEVLAAAADVPLLGEHNLQNAMAALAVTRAVGPVDAAVREALRLFRALPYRMQPAGTIAGIRFVNDSKGTTVDAVRAGVRGLPGTLVLGLGGRNKDLDFTALGADLERVRAVLVFGESAPEIERALAGAARLVRVRDLDEMIDRVLEIARPGDTFLFSPGCTSFDMFRDAEHRGEEFDAAVRRARARTEGAPRP